MKITSNSPILNPGNERLHTTFCKDGKSYCLIQYLTESRGTLCIMSDIYPVDAACNTEGICQGIGKPLFSFPMISEQLTELFAAAQGFARSYSDYEKYCEEHGCVPSSLHGFDAVMEGIFLSDLLPVILGPQQRKYLQRWFKQINALPVETATAEKIMEKLRSMHQHDSAAIRSNIVKILFGYVRRSMKKSVAVEECV